MQQQTIPVQVNGETRYLKAEMVEKLRRGQIALSTGGSNQMVKEILDAAFPKDKTVVTNFWPYYQKMLSAENAWIDKGETDLPTYPISAFFAEPMEGAVTELMGSRTPTEEELLKCDYDARVFAESLDVDEPYKSGIENGYAAGCGNTLSSLPAPIEQMVGDIQKKDEAIALLRAALIAMVSRFKYTEQGYLKADHVREVAANALAATAHYETK